MKTHVRVMVTSTFSLPVGSHTGKGAIWKGNEHVSKRSIERLTMGKKLTAGMLVRVIGTSDVGSLVMVREASQTCVIKMTDGSLKKNVPMDDVEEAKDGGAQQSKSPIRLAAAVNAVLALPPSTETTRGDNKSLSPLRKSGTTKRRLEVGDKVKARYEKGSKWFPGNITKVRLDGTYDVQYDDGDVETKVEEDCVEVVIPTENGNDNLKEKLSSPLKKDAAKSSRLDIGDIVKARYKKGSKWFPGKITKVRSDGTYDVQYDDGDVETKIEGDCIEVVVSPSLSSVERRRDNDSGKQRLPFPVKNGTVKFSVGDAVKARFKGGAKLYSGEIVKAHTDGTYDIRYDDSDVETRVNASHIERQDNADSSPSPSRVPLKSKELEFEVGDLVKAQYKNGSKFYDGKIMKVHSDGTCDVIYDDGDVEKRVSAKCIRREETNNETGYDSKSTNALRVGDKVHARYKKGNKFLSGEISRVREDGTVDVCFDDGDVELRVKPKDVRLQEDKGQLRSSSSPKRPKASVRPQIGDLVRARYRKGEKYYPGKIVRVHSDNTVDIKYEDGDTETRVEPKFVKFETESQDTADDLPQSGATRKQLCVGARVMARYRGGKQLLPGVIKRVHTDGSYDIKYDDGDTESRVDIEYIEESESSMSKSFSLGDKVKAYYNGGSKLYPGKIVKVRSNDTVDIKYDDGDIETGVDTRLVEPESGKRKVGEVDFTEGDVVLAFYKGGKKKYRGKITKVRMNGTCDIRYDDGDVETGVPTTSIEREPAGIGEKDTPRDIEGFRVGDKVMVFYKQGKKQYAGTIIKVHTNDTYDIEYDDGDVERKVDRKLIKPTSTPLASPSKTSQHQDVIIGDLVKAAHKKSKNRAVIGRVVRVRSDGTFDIDFDDGEYASRVSRNDMQPINSEEQLRKKEELELGQSVKARYKGGSKWFPGKITRVWKDGTYDIEYEDGDSEKMIAREAIEAVKLGRSIEDADSIRVGDTVNARSKGGSNWYEGKVTKIRADGSVDIRYDDGDIEEKVKQQNFRKLDHSGNSSKKDSTDAQPKKRGKNTEKVGQTEIKSQECDGHSSSSEGRGNMNPQITKNKRVTIRKAKTSRDRRIGRVKKLRSDKTCDIVYENGEVKKRVSIDSIQVCSDESDDKSDSASDSEHLQKNEASLMFRRNDRILSCWRRTSRLSKPALTSHWSEATVLSRDELSRTYSIKYDSGVMEEDVPQEGIQPLHRSTSNNVRDEQHAKQTDAVFLLEQLAMTLYEEGKMNKKPRIRFCNSSSSSSGSDSESHGSDTSSTSEDKRAKDRERRVNNLGKVIRRLFDRATLSKFEALFNGEDKAKRGRISRAKIIGLVASECQPDERDSVQRALFNWFSEEDALRTHSKFGFETFMTAFGFARYHSSKISIQQNMVNALNARFASHHETRKHLELWQQKLGLRTFESLQRLFHDSALPQMFPAQIRVRDLAEIFDHTTRSAVPNKPLEVYLQQMKLLPHHTLSLPEFMCCYYQLYGSDLRNSTHPSGWLPSDQLELRPLAFVASCLYSTGDPCCTRHGDLVRRLTVGRTTSQVDMIMRFREVFESMQDPIPDSSGALIMSTSQLEAFASKVVGDSSTLQQSILALRKRSATVSLVEIFATCGSVIDEVTQTPTVSNAINKMRLRLDPADVRRIIGLVRNICLKVLRFPHNPDYWRLRTNSEAFQQKLGRYHGATSLLESVGFVEHGRNYYEIMGSREIGGNRVGCLPRKTLDFLKERCTELDNELSALDGVESLLSILQRIATHRRLDVPLTLTECETILKNIGFYIENILKNPKDSRIWRIRENNKAFQRQIGYLPYCSDLMASIGYELVSTLQGNVYTLRGTGLHRREGNSESTATMTNFAFSSVSQQMEWFLWRRSEEIKSLLQDDMAYLVEMLGASQSDSNHTIPRENSLLVTKMYPYGRNAVEIFNKSATQKIQLKMIKAVFEKLDTHHQGYLRENELVAASISSFRSSGWAAYDAFDMDKDGRVDFADFVCSVGPALDYCFDPQDPGHFVSYEKLSLAEQVSIHVGHTRLHCARNDAVSVLDEIFGCLSRLIAQPSETRLWTIPNGARVVKQVERNPWARELLNLAGYAANDAVKSSDEGQAAFALKCDHQERITTNTPADTMSKVISSQALSRLQLICAIIGGHARLMLFPTVSDVGAVSRAIGEKKPATEWTKLIELAILCLDNILRNPADDDRYRQIKTTTKTFMTLALGIPGGLNLFIGLGFRETDNGTLVLPGDIKNEEIQARKMELETGLQVLRIKDKLGREAPDEKEFPSICSPDHMKNELALEYYKRKAIAAELAREEALRRSQHLEKQLEVAAKSSGNKSMWLSERSKVGVKGNLPRSSASKIPLYGQTRSNTASCTIEDEILGQLSPQRMATGRKGNQKLSDKNRRPTREIAQQVKPSAFDDKRTNTKSLTPRLTPRQQNGAQGSQKMSHLRKPASASSATAAIHESALAIDADAQSTFVVLRLSNVRVQVGALIRVSADQGDLTEERLITEVDSSTYPNLTWIRLSYPLEFPHCAKDLVFVLPPNTLPNAMQLLTTAFIEV